MAFDYGLAETPDKVRTTISRLLSETARQRPFGLDIETGYEGPERERAQLHPEEGFVAGLSLGGYSPETAPWARYIPLRHDSGPNVDNYVVAELLWELCRTGWAVIHNDLFEQRFLSIWFRELLSDHPVWGAEIRLCQGWFDIRSDTMLEAGVEAKYQSSAHRGSEDGIATEAALKPITWDTFGHEMMDIHALFELCAGPGAKAMTKKQKDSIRFNVLDLTGPYRQQITDYACEDAVWALAHHYHRYPLVKDNDIYRLEMANLPNAFDLEAEGICFDWAHMREGNLRAVRFAELMEAEVLADLGEMLNLRGIEGPCTINLNSPQQVSKTLYDQLGMPVSRRSRKTKKPSTDKTAMKTLSVSFPVIKKILNMRSLQKLSGTYLSKWPAAYNYAADGRAHAHYMQLGVAAGRWAANDPAIMQAPKEYHYELATGESFDYNFRDSVVAPPGWYGLGFDYSQIELRVLAGEAGETALIEAFARGEDVHKLTASRMLKIPLDQVSPKEHRPIGKTLNFAMGYQMGVDGLADRLGISKDEAQALFDAYFAGYPAIKVYMERVIYQAKRDGCIWTRFGRKVPIWEFLSSDRYIRSHGERLAGNAPIQGGAADYMKYAMVRVRIALIRAGLKDKVRIWLNMHDALEFYVHESVDPLTVIRVLQPAVIFEHALIAHWPPMVAEWHRWERWGSPRELKLTFGADGTVSGVEEEKPEPEAQSAAVDGDVEDGPALPDADLSLILGDSHVAPAGDHRPPASPAGLAAGGADGSDSAVHSGGGHAAVAAVAPWAGSVLIEINRMPDAGEMTRLMALIRESSGGAAVELHTPAGAVTLSPGCGLSPDRAAEIKLVLRDSAVRFDAAGTFVA